MATFAFLVFIPLAYLIARKMHVPNMGVAVMVSLLVPFGFWLLAIAATGRFSAYGAGYTLGECMIALVCSLLVMIFTFQNRFTNKAELDERSTKLLFAIDKKELMNFEKALAAFDDRAVKYLLVAGNGGIEKGADYYIGVSCENFGAFDQEMFTKLLHKHYYTHVSFAYVDLNADSELKTHLEQVNGLVENIPLS